MPNKLFLAQRTGILMDEQTIMNQVSGMLSSGDPYFDHGKKIPYECQHGFQFNINANSTVPTVNCDNGQWYGGKDCTGKVDSPRMGFIRSFHIITKLRANPLNLFVMHCVIYTVLCTKQSSI